MNSSPSVVVRKSGFLAALAKGVFGTLIAVVICGTALGVYGLRICDRHAETLSNEAMGLVHQVIALLPEWQKALPPQFAEALHDRRAPEYREHIDVHARLASSDTYRDQALAVIEVTNTGAETVSLLTLHVVLEDDDGIPLHESSVMAATPIVLDDDWRGPLLPGSSRRMALHSHRWSAQKVTSVTAELTDVRLWVAPEGNGDVANELEKTSVSTAVNN